ncbi:hypothetical protein [Bdellovibrio sp. KM01]|uniref:hypothetical protein n=1 Tax=Bdellovibrio sp. KM01 TaxID=2748865 RepID=UPI0015E97AAC|nr:hypothetical protein [Bdellovibrio sp. KM01]QLY24261.1 hypothetical protein HW988_12390 [Bdellovibrio sp. KM01]
MNSMKALIAAMVLAAAPVAMARECTDAQGNDILSQPAVFQELISKAANCYEAKELAEACAWGSSLDVRTAANAYAVCEANLAKFNPPKADTDLLNTMEARCQAHFDAEGGTMARSATAYCHLSAISFIVNLVWENEVY